ncbi:MAG: HAD family hydrolase [Nitrospirota bacterium]
MEKLVLFDIDGTLLHTGGAGTRAMNMAFQGLFGIEQAFGRIPMAGKTDILIMKEGLEAHGFNNTDGNLSNMIDAYLKHLEIEIDNPWKQLKPGIQEILNVLKETGIALGLLTGNLEKGARIKLEPFGLNKYFPEGAFGSDHENRDELLPIAIKRFSSRGLCFSPENCIVVGDTPRDVQCAKIHGAKCIAVATGPYSMEELLATDADIVFDSLADIRKCRDFITTV